MADYKHKRRPAPSRLLASFEAITLRQKPEDWQKVRGEMEEVMAEEVNKEDDKE
jgi:hypothetical protein